MANEAVSLLLIAHGSRRAEANADLEHLARQLAEKAAYAHIQVSFLELAPPGIVDGGTMLVEAGASNVVMVPYFLSPGIHVKDDLTEAQTTLAAKYPGVRFQLAAPLGRHPKLVDVVQERIQEVMGKP